MVGNGRYGEIGGCGPVGSRRDLRGVQVGGSRELLSYLTAERSTAEGKVGVPRVTSLGKIVLNLMHEMRTSYQVL